MLNRKCSWYSKGMQDLLLLPYHWRRKGRPVCRVLGLVMLVILIWLAVMVDSTAADDSTGYCRWVSQEDTFNSYEGVHEVYISFDNTDQTKAYIGLYVDMSADGDPATRQVYLCQDEFATVKQTFPNDSSPVSIQQSQVSITYHSMSLCVSKAFNFMKDTGLIQRDTNELTYLLLALNETWFITGPNADTNRLPLYTAGNQIERCSKDGATRPIAGVYCASTYSLNATNADEAQLGALGQGIFVTDYAPVTDYHPSIFVGSFNFVVGTFWGSLNLTSYDTPGQLATMPRKNPLTYSIGTNGNISYVLYYDLISVFIKTSLLDRVGDAQTIAVSYENRYTLQLGGNRLSCPVMYGQIGDIMRQGAVDGPDPGILPNIIEDPWKQAQGLVIGCVAAFIMVVFVIWSIRVDKRRKKAMKRPAATMLSSKMSFFGMVSFVVLFNYALSMQAVALGGPGAARVGGPPSPVPPDSGILSYFPEWLSSNPYFGAGFGLVGVGAVMGLLRTSSTSLQTVFRRRALCSLEIPSKDYSYQWVMQWLVTKNGRYTQHIGVETNHSKDVSGRMTTSFDFIPSPGRHLMKFNGAWMLVERERNNSTVDITTGSPWETLTLTTLAWNAGKFQELLLEAQSMAANREEGKTVIYNAAGHEWRPFGNPKTVRPFDSVILDGTAAETIASDVKEFLSTGSWYLDRGIPYRRGYLFYGPPGCGKTSYIMALAGHIQYNIAVLNLGDPTMSDDRLQRLLATVPPKCLILLEDVDCVLPEYEPSEKPPADSRHQGIRPMTFSGLLNALDGVGSTEERLVFMTTNRPSFLPPVLVRPGRVDVKVHVGLATREQMRRMFVRFYPDAIEWAEEFAR
ncbi:mitochondrial chaperone [Perkinsus olseni]|uniref:Mitochondrial chaperone n=1 Tax=Perkinsus olseni TaxID=32597 RepID=A0A7J6TKH6_PEROL|nr:mitochondrial chaperone [Perkinsus olseni]